jgi:branched-chain amino acid transport system substrate-binding protein
VRRYRHLAAIAGSLAIASALAACGGSKLAASADPSGAIPSGPIVIGMPIALTGPINAYDGNTLTGAQLAASAVNAAGGVDGHKVTIITADTASSIAQGSTAAEQVIAQGAQFIIPTIDYNYGGGAARVAQGRNLITISAADDTRFGMSIGNDVFNLDTGGPTEGAVLAQYAYATLKWRKAYVLEDTSLAAAQATCNTGFRQSFTAFGGTSSVETFQETSESSIVSAVSQAQRAVGQEDGVVLCGNPPSGATVIRQLRAAGVSLPLLLSDGFDGNFWESSVPDLVNTHTISFGPVTPGQDKQNEAAEQAYAAAQRAGKTVTQSLGFLAGYSAVQAIADAVKATGSVSASKIRPYFETFKNHPLAIGPTTWTGSCHARAGNPLVIANFKNGEEQYVASVTPTKLPADDC